MDKKQQKTIAAVLIIIGSLATLGFKFWADGQALNADRPEIIRNGPGHSLSVLIGDQLFSLQRDGSTRKTIDLAAHGIHPIGDIAYFSNGDMLIYIETSKQSLTDSIAQFMRLQETDQQPPMGENGLYRCNANAEDCHLFSDQLPAFHATFRAFIDTRDDTVYLADTPRFAIYKLDQNGQELGRKTDELWFPNQILLHNNLLYVANTNRHVISVLRTDNEHFGEVVERHAVKTADGSHRWPAELIRVKNQWWVSVFDDNMEHGQVQRFGDDWQYLDVLPLDRQADAATMAAFTDSVFVGDWSNIELYRFDLAGNRLDDFHNPQIDAVLDHSRSQVKLYQIYSWMGLLAFAVVFVAGVAAAFIIEKKETIAVLNGITANPKPLVKVPPPISPPGNDVYWIETRLHKKRRRYSIQFAIGLGLLAVGVAMSIFGLKTIDYALTLQLLMLFMMIAVGIWFWFRLIQFRIGVFKGQLLIDNGKGEIVIGKGDDIQYNRTMLMIRNQVAILGQPGKRLYPDEEIDKWVVPLMLQGRETGIWSMYRVMWGSRHPYLILLIAMLAFLLSITVTLLL